MARPCVLRFPAHGAVLFALTCTSEFAPSWPYACMLTSEMTPRWLRSLACIGLLGWQLAYGCTVYNPDLVEEMQGGSGGHAGNKAGSGGEPPEPCVPSAEICNDKDDDCNGVVDDMQPASLDCSERYHANVTCGRGGFCLFVPSSSTCYPGWYHCDGLPETGCETMTPCIQPDAGPQDDGGSDDAG